MRVPPFDNCSFRECDLPGQCRAEGRCHHPRPAPYPAPSPTSAQELVERAAILLETFATHGMLSHYEDGRETENAKLCRETATPLRSSVLEIPEGWALVPKEPTREMLIALMGNPVVLAASDEVVGREAYRVMLTAAAKGAKP